MSNVFQDKNIVFKYNRNKDLSIVPPKVFLKTKTLKRIGLIDPVFELEVVTNFNEPNTCSFTIHKKNNGVDMSCFDRIKNLSVIEIQGFGLFQIDVTTVDEYDTSKKITGTALQESELSQLDCTLEINTESDISRSDYDKEYPTLFYRDLSTLPTEEEKKKCQESSLLHRILTYAPLYSIGHVDDSLMGICREFSCENSYVWDFLQDVAEEVGCVFICDPFSRTINAYDLKDHCTKCGGRHIIDGECAACGKDGEIEPGYGLNTSVYVDTTTIAQSIEDSVDTSQIKNCFKLVAGDDVITNRIGQRLIGNSNYLWNFSEDQINEFSDELRDKWLEYPDHVKKYQEEFDAKWNIYNDAVNKKLYWESGKSPVIEVPRDSNDSPDYKAQCEKIYEEICEKIPYYVIGSKNAVLSTVAKNILRFANFICPQGYKVEYQRDNTGKERISCETEKEDNINVIKSFTGYLYIYLANCKDDNQEDKYFYESPAWKLDVIPGYDKIATDENGNEIFTHNYYLYLKQMIDYKMANSDVTFEPKYDTDYSDDAENHKDDSDYYINYFKEYSIHRLNSFKDAYDLCTTILLELDADLATNEAQKAYNYFVDENSKKVSSQTMYERLMEKYQKFSECIYNIIKEYTGYVEKEEEKIEEAKREIKRINEACNIKNYLGSEELYNELISFKRVQTYENPNFTSNVIDEATLMENIEEFILAAKEEIATACEFQHNVPISMANLLTLTDYEDVFEVFALGNYINTKINGELVKLRIISIPFRFDQIESCEVVFSDALVGNQRLKDIHREQHKSSSIASSFDYVQKQTTKNDVKLDSFSKMFSDGLNATKTMIMNADDISTKIDNHGILTRQLDLNTGEYLPEQIIITNGTIGYTADNWSTIKSAFGKFFWNGEYRYGLIGEAIVGKLFAGDNLTIGDEAGNVRITKDGITLKGGSITWDEPMEMKGVDGLKKALDGIDDSIKDLKGSLDDIAADNKLTPSEKEQLNISWLEIQKEYEKIVEVCESEIYKITFAQSSGTNESAKYQTYKDSYDTLQNYLAGDNGLLESLNTTSDIVSDTFKSNFSVYFDAREDLNDTIRNVISKEHAKTISKENIDAFKKNVAEWITGDATTKIDSTSVFAPKIGGGYLYICNKNGYSVEINPLGTNFTGHNGDYIFNIAKNKDVIMGVDTNGNGYFKGDITGSTIAGSIIEGSEISGGTITSVSDKNRKVVLENGTIQFGNIKITNNLLMNYKNDENFSNALNFSSTYNNAEFGFRWWKNDDTGKSFVNLISAKERPLNIGETDYPIHNIIINGTISDSSNSYLNIGGEGLRVKNIEASGNITTNGNITASNNNSNATVKADKAEFKSTLIGDLLSINTVIDTTNTNHMIFGDKSNQNEQLKFIFTGNEFGLIIEPVNNGTCCLGEPNSRFKYIYANAYNEVSDRKEKKDIEYFDSSDAIQLINQLKPARYKFKDNTYGKTHYGLIAQDVEDSLLELGWDRCDFAGLVKSPIDKETEGFDKPEENYFYSLRYNDFISPLISYCQNLYEELQKQKEEIQKLKNSL